MRSPGATTTTPPTVVVVGASFAGLFAAAAAAAAGLTVEVLERDALVDDGAPRRGVPQGGQGHVLLHRGLLAAGSLLPGLADDVRRAGAVEFDSGTMPFRGDLGWLPTGTSYPILSISRVRLEEVVRARVRALPGVRFLPGVRVSGLRRADGSTQVVDEAGTRYEATWVVDASGRSSRLPHWLSDVGVAVPEPETIDAGLGYAARTFTGTVPVRTAIRMMPTATVPRGGTALPLEGGRWLVGAEGYGADRPGRDVQRWTTFLEELPDPALADLVASLEPVDDDEPAAVYRQTANRRRAYGAGRDWPPGLLAVGDALCAFNPVYGQGITVAALQGCVLRDAWRADPSPRRSRRLQRRLGRPAAMAWQTSTSEDQRMLHGQRFADRVLGAWVDRVARRSMAGDPVCAQALADVYHLMRPASVLLGPRVVAAAVTSRRAGASGRPAVLEELAAGRRAAQPTVAAGLRGTPPAR